MPDTTAPAAHMTVAEAADQLGISTQRVYRMVKTAELPAVRPWPHAVFIPTAAVEQHRDGGVQPVHKSACRLWLLDRINADTIADVGGEDLFDLCFEFISERRPTLTLDAHRQWAASMSTQLLA